MKSLTLFGLGTLGLWLIAAQDKAPSIEQIMEKSHKAKTGLRTQIDNELKKSDPDWASIQKKTKEYAQLAEFLPKSDPPQGDKKSWEKLSKEFVVDAKALDAAAAKKDLNATKEVQKRLGARCDACHEVHQP